MFKEMAEAAGLPAKAMYTIAEVASTMGIAASTVYDAARCRRLTTFTPGLGRRGKLVRPEWVDEWVESCTTHAL